MSGGILSVDEVCVAVENTLRVALVQVLELPATKEYLGDRAKGHTEIKEWVQLPTLESISTAKLPAIAITTPGLVSPPQYVRSGDKWETTWRVGIGVYDRDRDHDNTQRKVRDWVAFIRTALLRNVTLGGVARGLTWAGEEYDLLPARAQARTIGAGALAVDIRVDVPNTLGIGLPPVASVHPELFVQTQE